MNRTKLGWTTALGIALVQAGCMMVPMGAGAQGGGSGLQLLTAAGFDCPNVNNSGVQFCRIEIELFVTGNVCTAKVPSPIQFKGTVNDKLIDRLVVWTLKTPTVVGKSFAFQDNYGVIVTKEPKGHPQLYNLRPGDRSSTGGQFFLAINRQDWMGDPDGSTYYPIIIMTDTSTTPAQESVCAVLDPKIINTN